MTYLCPGQSDADPVVHLQEADVVVVVAADEGEEDEVIFLPLVVVHRRHSHALELPPRHLFADQVHLQTVALFVALNGPVLRVCMAGMTSGHDIESEAGERFDSGSFLMSCVTAGAEMDLISNSV